VVTEVDLAMAPSVPWTLVDAAQYGRFAYWRDSLVVHVLTVLWITPKGVVEVHEMLFETTQHLTLGGETGIFTPMHMVLLRKPAAF
jgi:24-methylenesterol C-methyltransferase